MNQQRSERDKEFDALWEKGQPIEIKKSQGEKKMSVFSMKIDRELLRVLVETAKQREIGPSTLARELIQEGLLSRGERLSNESLIGIICNRLAENSIHPIDAHNESIKAPLEMARELKAQLPAKMELKAESASAAAENIWIPIRKSA